MTIDEKAPNAFPYQYGWEMKSVLRMLKVFTSQQQQECLQNFSVHQLQCEEGRHQGKNMDCI